MFPKKPAETKPVSRVVAEIPRFEWGVYELGRNCEIHIFDPTSNAPPQLKSIGATLQGLGPGGWFLKLGGARWAPTSYK